MTSNAVASRACVPDARGAAEPPAGLCRILGDHRSAVLERWRSMVFRSEKDPFRNPVGHSLLRGTEVLYDGVVLGRETASVLEALESIVRLRAVQDFSASQAVAFVFWLKRAVREQVREVGVEEELWRELAAFDERIDALVSAAFDLYGDCRERIYRIRADALGRSTAALRMQYEAGGRSDGVIQAACEADEPGGGCEP
jgi:hypothetical protein